MQDTDPSRRERHFGALKRHNKSAQGKRAVRRASPRGRAWKKHPSPVSARQSSAPTGWWSQGDRRPRATLLQSRGVALGWRVSPRWGVRASKQALQPTAAHSRSCQVHWKFGGGLRVGPEQVVWRQQEGEVVIDPGWVCIQFWPPNFDPSISSSWPANLQPCYQELIGTRQRS